MELSRLVDSLAAFFRYDPDQQIMFNTRWFLLAFLVFYGIYQLMSSLRFQALVKQAVAAITKTTDEAWLNHLSLVPRILFVTIFSLFFYYKTSGAFFILLLLSTFLDYVLGLMIFMYQHDEILHRRVGKNGHRRLIDLTYWFGLDHASRFVRKRPLRAEPFIVMMEYLMAGLDRIISRIYPPEQRRKKQRFFLVTSIIVNLGLLAYFKYTYFLVENLGWLTGKTYEVWQIVLPVGISFFTFQTMSYTIDIYRRKLEPVSNILDFAFYVSFFPQLVAGPIVRASDFIPQIRARIRVNREELGRGLMLICLGLFKKAVISDYISFHYVDNIFADPTYHTGFENLMAVYGYALQIYCDFSGYSDMAIGMGLLMGYRLPDNFRTPYQSTSIQEFWRRWHISLSTWLRDYLYISLGGNRRGKFRTYLNLLITMLLGGLWHGANWMFIIWGALHGIALAIDRMSKDIKALIRTRIAISLDRTDRQASRGFGWYLSLGTSIVFQMVSLLFTFHFVCFCWIFFKVGTMNEGSLDKVWDVCNQIAYNFQGQIASQVIFSSQHQWVFLLMLVGYFMHMVPPRRSFYLQERFVWAWPIVKSAFLAMVIWLVILVQQEIGGPQPFIYYQF